jgi:hypothetical protein
VGGPLGEAVGGTDVDVDGGVTSGKGE